MVTRAKIEVGIPFFGCFRFWMTGLLTLAHNRRNLISCDAICFHGIVNPWDCPTSVFGWGCEGSLGRPPSETKNLEHLYRSMRQVSVYVFVCDTYSVRLFPFLLRETWWSLCWQDSRLCTHALPHRFSAMQLLVAGTAVFRSQTLEEAFRTDFCCAFSTNPQS